MSASGFWPWTTFSCTWRSRSAVCSVAERATPTMAEAEVSESDSVLSAPTSDFIVEAMAHEDELSFAVATLRPVEISLCTLPMSLLMLFSV